jgi:hypothetical protein
MQEFANIIERLREPNLWIRIYQPDAVSDLPTAPDHYVAKVRIAMNEHKRHLTGTRD